MRHIDIREVFAVQNWSQSINTEDFNNIIWEENGVPIDVDPKVVEEFRSVGLDNLDFINIGFYKMTGPIFETKENDNGFI